MLKLFKKKKKKVNFKDQIEMMWKKKKKKNQGLNWYNYSEDQHKFNGINIGFLLPKKKRIHSTIDCAC